VNDALRRSAAHALVEDLSVPSLADHDVHHLFDVLRLRAGEVVTVTDGCGRWRCCRVVHHGVEPDGDVVVEPALDPVTVAVAIPKQDRPEWLVQKLTELGVDRIVLLHTARSVVRWDDHRRVERHLERLTRVMIEAAMQSRRVWVPQLVGPVDASPVLASMPVAEPGGRPLAASDRAVAVGPEGGWTAQELATAPDTIALGDGILRVETAAVAAAARMVANRSSLGRIAHE
jgi:16S rRNA (uracil1498-N3)-methyltransferase